MASCRSRDSGIRKILAILLRSQCAFEGSDWMAAKMVSSSSPNRVGTGPPRMSLSNSMAASGQV